MLGNLLDDIAEDNELWSGTLRLLSLLFLLIAAVLSLLKYTTPVTGWTWDRVPSYVWPWRHEHKVRCVNFRMVEYWPASRRAIEAWRSDVDTLGDGVGKLVRNARRVRQPEG